MHLFELLKEAHNIAMPHDGFCACQSGQALPYCAV